MIYFNLIKRIPHHIPNMDIMEIIDVKWIDYTYYCLAKYKLYNREHIGEFKLLPTGLKFIRQLRISSKFKVRYCSTDNYHIVVITDNGVNIYKEGKIAPETVIPIDSVKDVIVTDKVVCMVREIPFLGDRIEVYLIDEIFAYNLVPHYSINVSTSNIRLELVDGYIMYISGIATAHAIYAIGVKTYGVVSPLKLRIPNQYVAYPVDVLFWQDRCYIKSRVLPMGDKRYAFYTYTRVELVEDTGIYIYKKSITLPLREERFIAITDEEISTMDNKGNIIVYRK